MVADPGIRSGVRRAELSGPSALLARAGGGAGVAARSVGVLIAVLAGSALLAAQAADATSPGQGGRELGDVELAGTAHLLAQVDPAPDPSPEAGTGSEAGDPEPDDGAPDEGAPDDGAPGGATPGGATGPSPTGQPRPDASQRTLDTVIWVGLLASLAVAAVVVVRVWRDVGVDPPLVDVEAPPRGERPDADK